MKRDIHHCVEGLTCGHGWQGKRAALPSATIMLRQPIQRFQQMQASDIDIYRNELRKTNAEIVSLWPTPSLAIDQNCGSSAI